MKSKDLNVEVVLGKGAESGIDPSMSILDVGVEEAIKFSGFDEKMFLKRGGKYVWSKADLKLDW